MSSAPYLVGDTADFEGMSMRMLIGDETADSGNAYQDAFVALFTQSPVGSHA